ncbi:MAG: PIN domain-containing protein [Candidatus Micrarchaeota archaeon]
MKRALIDTNVLAYACDETDAKSQVALKAIAGTDGGGVVSIQNLAELASILTRKKGGVSGEKAQMVLRRVRDALEVVSYDDDTVLQAVAINREYGTHFYDALIAAAMREAGLRTIITENSKDFRGIPEINVVNPFKE